MFETNSKRSFLQSFAVFFVHQGFLASNYSCQCEVHGRNLHHEIILLMKFMRCDLHFRDAANGYM
jgi:hypothetical protein